MKRAEAQILQEFTILRDGGTRPFAPYQIGLMMRQ
jgi:hypothetical protein